MPSARALPQARCIGRASALRLCSSVRPSRRQQLHVCADASAPVAAAAAAGSAPATLGLTVVSFEGNSMWFKFEQSGARVLVDPWLVGDLTFFDQPWLYTARKSEVNKTVAVDVDAVAADTDVLLLTQWVDDHVHVPTLRALPKSLPVVAQCDAADRVRALGFTNVTPLRHGETAAVADGRVDVTATAGALVGPPWVERQNCFLLRERRPPAAGAAAGPSVYLDPHCDYDAAALQALAGRVDVVVTPCATVRLAGYPLLLGSINLEELLGALKPRVYVPLLNTDIEGDGPLDALMSKEGGAEGLEARLAARGIAARVALPARPGQPLAL